MEKQKWWFGFRQTSPEPPGQAIACGPYGSYDEAKKEREKSKARECEVSVPYSAATNEEAKEKAKQVLS